MFNNFAYWLKNNFPALLIGIIILGSFLLICVYLHLEFDQLLLILAIVSISLSFIFTKIKNSLKYYKDGKLLVPKLSRKLEREESEKQKLVRLFENLFLRREFTKKDLSQICIDLFDEVDLGKYNWEKNHKYTNQEFFKYNDFNSHFVRTPQLKNAFISGVLNETTVYWFYDSYKRGDYNNYQFKHIYEGSFSYAPKSTLVFIDDYLSEDKLMEFDNDYKESKEREKLLFNTRSFARDYLENYKLMMARTRFFENNLYEKLKSFKDHPYELNKINDYDYYEKKKINITAKEEIALLNIRLQLILTDGW